jgi:Leucine-rich repeat (LRR) protein
MNRRGADMAQKGNFSRKHLFALSCHVFLSIVLVGLLTLAIPAPAVKADSLVYFPDPNLRAVIREAIGKPTGDIYQSDLDTLVTLNAATRGITDLTGLEHCISLTWLDLADNQIGDISPLAGLSSLTILNLHTNQIGDISPLAGLSKLTELVLRTNQISDISPLAGLSSLAILNLHTNQISDISPLTDLTNLTELRLYSNQISDISPLAGLVKLTDLRLYSNQISDISPLAGLTKLTELLLGKNKISDISPLAGLGNLTILNLHANQISDIKPLVDNPGIASGDTVYLNTNPLSSTSVDDYILALEARGVEVYWDVPDSLAPNQPGNVSPVGSGSSLTPILQSTVFSDPDAGDTHAASWWQVRTTSGDYSGSVFDSYADNTSLTIITIPSGTLDYSTTYYWHVRHKNSHGAWSPWSAETPFRTVPTYPLVTTNDPSSVTTTSVRLNGDLTWLGTASTVMVSCVWGTSSGSHPNETTGLGMTSTGTFYFDLGGLDLNTIYYYRAKAAGHSTVYGVEKSFSTTDGAAPVISLAVSSAVTVSGATITWTTNEPATSQVEYGLTASYGSRTTWDSNLVNDHGVDLTGLEPGRTYHYRVISIDAALNRAESADGTFTTAPRSGRMPIWAWLLIGLGAVGVVTMAAFLNRGRMAQ